MLCDKFMKVVCSAINRQGEGGGGGGRGRGREGGWMELEDLERLYDLCLPQGMCSGGVKYQ